MIEIFGVLVSNISPKTDLEAMLDHRFACAWQQRHQTLRDAKARRASLLGILLLQAAGVRGELYYDHQGRPQLLDKSIDFNITHTAECVFCAVEALDSQQNDSQAQIGIDAEDVGRGRQMHKHAMARRWFTASEQALFFADDTDDSFLQIWTRKESLVKWSGEGLSALAKTDTTNAESLWNVHFRSYRESGALITLCHRIGTTPPDAIRMLGERALMRLCKIDSDIENKI